MSRKSKISKEEKLETVIKILNNEESISVVSKRFGKRFGINRYNIRYWIMHYQTEGPEGLETKSTNRHYSPEPKLEAVKAYLNGQDKRIKNM